MSDELRESDLLDALALADFRACDVDGHGNATFDPIEGVDICDRCGARMEEPPVLPARVDFARPDGLVRRMSIPDDGMPELTERAAEDHPWSPPLEATVVSLPKIGRFTALFEMPDRHAFLIERWLDGRWTIAERFEPDHSWSPPLEGTEA